MVLQKFRDFLRVADVALHAHVQGFRALQQQERVERRQRRAEGAMGFHARAHDVAEVAEGFVKAHAVIALRGLGHAGKFAVAPIKFARFDDHAAHGGAVAADEFSRGMHDDVGAVFDRAAQVGRGESVVDHERYAGFFGDGADRFDVEHVAARVADGFAVDGFGFRGDRFAKILRIFRVDELDVDAEFFEVEREQRIGTAIQGAGGNDFIARLNQGQQRDHLRRLAAGAC